MAGSNFYRGDILVADLGCREERSRFSSCVHSIVTSSNSLLISNIRDGNPSLGKVRALSSIVN